MSNLETPPAPPAEPAPPQPAPDAKPTPARGDSVDRSAMAVSTIVQIVVVLFIVVIANYLGFKHFIRWDLSRNNQYELSSHTKNVLGRLKERNEQVQTFIFFPSDYDLGRQVENLLREYRFASDQRFSYEVVSLSNLARARQIAEKYQFGERENVVIIDYKGKTKFLKPDDLAIGDQNRRAFRGEDAVTSALLELGDEKASKLYFVQGHGEIDIDSDQAAVLKRYLERLNIKIEKLNLNAVDAVPTEATGVMLFGPQSDLSEREMKLLSEFWKDRKGRFVILLNPAAKTPRLDQWLADEGVTVQHDTVLRTMVIQQFLTGVDRNPVGTILPSSSPVTRDIAGRDMQFLGATTSVAIDLEKGQRQGNRIVTLVESLEGYWGETNPSQERIFFDASADHAGPLKLAVTVEKGGLEDARVKVETGRMVIVGNANFITYDGLDFSNIGLPFALNTINWAFNREVVAGIPPKAKELIRLSLTDDQVSALAKTVLLYIPVAVGIIGLLVWGVRSERFWTAIVILLSFGALIVLGWVIGWLQTRYGGSA